MSDEIKEKAFDFPMMPIFGVDLGERLGSMDARLAKLEAALTSMNEQMKTFSDASKYDRALLLSILAAVLAGLILQYLR